MTPFQILAGYAWAKVNLKNLQAKHKAQDDPETAVAIGAAIKELGRARRLKRKLDALNE